MRVIWEAMGVEPEFDELSVCDRMKPTHLDSIGGMAFVSGLSMGAVTTSNVEYYADRVRDAYLKREVQSNVSEILQADDSVSGADLLSKLMSASGTLTASLTSTGRTLDTVVGEEIARALEVSSGPSGVPTGIGLDGQFPGGLPKGKITTIFADTGSFKSTLSLQMMFHMASSGHKGLHVPLEDDDELTAHRWMARMTGVPYGTISGGVTSAAEKDRIRGLKPKDWAYLKNVESVDGIEPKIDSIIRAVAAENARRPLDFVLVDYLQLLQGRGNQQEVITEAMRKTQVAAKRYNVCWIFLSQQNDKNMDRKDPRPHLGDMFGSSAAKQCSKSVIALFRPSEHWPNPGGVKHPLWGMYARMIERNPNGAAIYKNLLEVWVLKNIYGAKKSLHGLIAKPAVGVLDPVDIRRLTQ
jgi:replicative DNA helicase